MDYKQFLIQNRPSYLKIRQLLDDIDPTYFVRTVVNEQEIGPQTVSIVMTACNRSVQTYYTIKNIARSAYKDVQVIIVDDSTDDPIVADVLATYGIHTELIQIRNKFWINPCVNYNIGFRHVRGGKVVVQNAEVCHIDDVVTYVADHVGPNEYHAFNVSTIPNMETNYLLYEIEPISANIDQIVSLAVGHLITWYQHPIVRNGFYHFLVATDRETFDRIGGFDNDYAMAIEYDDDNFIFKARTMGLSMINVPPNVMGVHQWHSQSAAGSCTSHVRNRHLHYRKCAHFEATKTYLNFTDLDAELMVEKINEWF